MFGVEYNGDHHRVGEQQLGLGSLVDRQPELRVCNAIPIVGW
jgi:hypothetical protein